MRQCFLLLAAFSLLCTGYSRPAAAQWRWTPETGRFINLKRLPKESPELQVEHARSLMVSGDYREALQATDKFLDFYGDSEEADENQYLRGEIKMIQSQYLVAAKEFQQVVVNYPDSGLYDDVIAEQYGAGDALFEKGAERLGKTTRRKWYRLGVKWRPFRNKPMRNAIDVYSMVIDNQPFTAEAAEAQYKLGLSHFTLKEYIDAAFEYRRVLEDYMGSNWQSEASYGLAQCYEKGSLDPAYDQSPSELAIRAIDSFSSRYPSDPRTEDLVVVRSTMREKVSGQRLETARYYERRRHLDSARIYYEVVVEQFGDTEAADVARRWLEEHRQE